MSHVSPIAASQVYSVSWSGDIDGHLQLIDQTLLPQQLKVLDLHTLDEAFEAIVMLRVRGAPAIGIAAAYAVLLGIQRSVHQGGAVENVRATTIEVCNHLATSRPTAVNLFWALDRMRAVVARSTNVASGADLAKSLLREARLIHDDDRRTCHAIGDYGAQLFDDGFGILTHCNTGGLATSEYGTALAAIFTAQDQGKNIHVYADETRPLLQGSRLTAWELQQRGIPCTVICDSMAAQVMREGRVQAVIVGADRITARGDTANKIGTYGLAVLAKFHNIPFYVAAPRSTFDLSIVDGNDIPIEQRKADEIVNGFGRQTAPDGIGVYNPAFDVTPHDLITAIVTERGIIAPVIEENVRFIVGG